MRIKELAERSGVSVRSIRHYEAAGLLTSEREPNGYRAFDEHAVVRARNIKALVDVGLTLEDVREFDCCLDGDVASAAPAPGKVELARSRLHQLERRRDELAAACERLARALEASVRDVPASSGTASEN